MRHSRKKAETKGRIAGKEATKLGRVRVVVRKKKTDAAEGRVVHVAIGLVVVVVVVAAAAAAAAAVLAVVEAVRAIATVVVRAAISARVSRTTAA